MLWLNALDIRLLSCLKFPSTYEDTHTLSNRLNELQVMRILVIILVLFSFRLSAQVSKIKAEKEDTMVCDFPDELAEYPGGYAAVLSEIRSALMNPTGCMDCVGTIYIKFVVTKKGKISQITALNTINGCSKLKDEAIRAVETLVGPFTPAKLKGVAVNSYMQLPIKFKLTG
jgi:hypothetical protein